MRTVVPKVAEVRATYCAGGCGRLVPIEEREFTLTHPNQRRVIKHVCEDCFATKPVAELFPLPSRRDGRRRIERVEDPNTLP